MLKFFLIPALALGTILTAPSAYADAPAGADLLVGVWTGQVKCGPKMLTAKMYFLQNDRREGYIDIQGHNERKNDIVKVSYGGERDFVWANARKSWLGQSNEGVSFNGRTITQPDGVKRIDLAITGLRNCSEGRIWSLSTAEQANLYWWLLRSDDLDAYGPKLARLVSSEHDKAWAKYKRDNPQPTARDWAGLAVTSTVLCAWMGCFEHLKPSIGPQKAGGGNSHPDRFTNQPQGGGGRSDGHSTPSSGGLWGNDHGWKAN